MLVSSSSPVAILLGWGLICASLVAGCDASGDNPVAAKPNSTQPGRLGTHAENIDASLTEPEAVVSVRILPGLQAQTLKVELRTAERALILDLVEHRSLLAADAVIQRGAETLTPAEAELSWPYRGTVVGAPDSWARVRRVGDGVEGVIGFNGQLWELRGSGAEGQVLGRGDIADYLDAPQRGDHRCAVSSEEAAHARYVDHEVEASGDCQSIDIAVVADYSHVSSLGSVEASEAEMLARMNEIDGMYRSDLNYGFSIRELTSFPNEGAPAFNVSSTSTTPLDEFAAWKSAELPNRGLAHLFVGRTRSGVVGLAWVGATCQRSHGTGVSNYLGTGRASTIVAAHELGHNFGSGHDESNSTFVMRPSVWSSATQFSAQSKSAIHRHVAAVDCFVPCSDDDGDDGGDDSGSDSGESSSSGDTESSTETGSDSGTDETEGSSDETGSEESASGASGDADSGGDESETSGETGDGSESGASDTAEDEGESEEGTTGDDSDTAGDTSGEDESGSSADAGESESGGEDTTDDDGASDDESGSDADDADDGDEGSDGEDDDGGGDTDDGDDTDDGAEGSEAEADDGGEAGDTGTGTGAETGADTDGLGNIGIHVDCSAVPGGRGGAGQVMWLGLLALVVVRRSKRLH